MPLCLRSPSTLSVPPPLRHVHMERIVMRFLMQIHAHRLRTTGKQIQSEFWWVRVLYNVRNSKRLYSIIPHSHCTSKQGRAEPSYASWAKCHLNRTVPEVVHLWLGYRGGVVQFGCIKVQLAFILWEIYNRASVARFGFNVQCERSIRKSISTYQDDVRRLFWGFCWSCSTTHSIYTSKQVAQQNNRDIMVV